MKKNLLLRLALLLFLPVAMHAQTYWRPTGGPGGISIQALAKSNTGALLAASGGELFRSPDNGGNWIPVGMEEQVYSLCFQNGVWYAGTNEGLFRATGCGDQWSAMGLNGYRVLAVLPEAGTYTYAGTAGHGLFRTADNGLTWEPAGLDNHTVYTLGRTTQGYLLAGTESGISRSTDGGLSWPQVVAFDRPVWTLVAGAQGQWFAGGHHIGVQRSLDNGASWQPQSLGLDQQDVYTLVADGQALFAGTGAGLYQSANNGNQWSVLGLPNNKITAILRGAGSQLFAGSESLGLYRSVDAGKNWAQSLKYDKIVAILAGAGSLRLAFGGAGIFRSIDNCETWENVALAPFAIRFAATGPQGAFFAGSQEVLYRSLDNGYTWLALTTPAGVIPRALAVNAQGTLFMGTNQGLFVSNDNGNQWTASGLKGFDVRRIVLHPQGPLFAVYRYQSGQNTLEGIQRSDNNGVSWTSLGIAYSNIHTLQVSPGGTLFAGTAEGLIRSTDGGTNWHKLMLDCTHIGAIAFNSIGDLYVGDMGVGVFHSSDLGDTWEGLNDGLDYPWVSALGFDREDFLFAGTAGAGVYRTTEATGTLEPVTMPVRLYPNPVRHSAILDVSLSTASDLQWFLTAADGRVLRLGTTGTLSAGRQQVRLDLSGVLSGTYWLRVETGAGVAVQTVVIGF